MNSPKKPQSAEATSLVAYERALIEDAELLLVGPATIDISASLPARRMTRDDLTMLRPNVVSEEVLSQSSLRFGSSSVSVEGDGFISLAFWLEDSVVVLRCRRLIMEAVLDSWVDRVRSNGTTVVPSDSGIGCGQRSIAG